MNCQHLGAAALISSHPPCFVRVPNLGLEVIFSLCNGVSAQNKINFSIALLAFDGVWPESKRFQNSPGPVLQ